MKEAFKMATELVKDWEQRDKEGQFHFKDLVKDIKKWLKNPEKEIDDFDFEHFN